MSAIKVNVESLRRQEAELVEQSEGDPDNDELRASANLVADILEAIERNGVVTVEKES